MKYMMGLIFICYFIHPRSVARVFYLSSIPILIIASGRGRLKRNTVSDEIPVHILRVRRIN